MNKLFNKIAASIVGIAMAVGVGVAVGSQSRGEVRSVKAAIDSNTNEVAYEVVFVKGANDSATTAPSIDSGVDYATIGTTNKAYARTKGLHLGSSSATGSQVINLTSGTSGGQINATYLSVYAIQVDAGKQLNTTVQYSDGTSETDTTATGSTLSYIDIELDSSKTISSITFSSVTKSKGRVAVDSFKVYKEKEATDTLNSVNLSSTSGGETSVDTLTVKTGKQAQVYLTAVFSMAGAVDKTSESAWTSGDENIATISGGLITGVAVGSTTITATYGEKTASLSLTVTQGPVVTLSNKQISPFLENQTKSDITITADYFEGTPSITATSGSTNLTASVINSGTGLSITAASNLTDDEKAVVTVTADDGIDSVTAELDVFLKAPVLTLSSTSVNVKPTASPVSIVATVNNFGNSPVFTAVGNNDSAFTVSLSETTITITPVAEGAGKVTVTSVSADETITRQAEINVTIADVLEYSLVNDDSLLTEGSKLIFASTVNSASYAMGQQGTAKYRASVSTTISDNKISGPSSDIKVIELEGEEGAWYLKTDEGYLYLASNSNELYTKETADETCLWSISIADGIATVESNKISGRIIKYNSSSPRFACYTSGQNNIQIFGILAPARTLATISSISADVSASNGDTDWTIENVSVLGRFTDSTADEDVTKYVTNVAVTTALPQITESKKMNVTIRAEGKLDSTIVGTSTVEATLTYIDLYSLYSIERLYDGEQCPLNNNYDFDGVYMGEVADGYIFMNGAYGMLVYDKSHSQTLSIGTAYSVNGTLKTYSGLYEVDDEEIATASTERAGAVLVPETHIVTGNETASDASRKTELTGYVKSMTSTAQNANSTVVVVVNGIDITVYVKAAQATEKNMTALSDNMTANEGKESDFITIEMEGYTNWHNGFQVSLTQVVVVDDTYTIYDFARSLLKETLNICTGIDRNNKTALVAVWSELKGANYYGKLTAAKKADLAAGVADSSVVVPSTSTDIDGMSDSDALGAALYRYDFCTAKYNLNNFISGRTLSVSFSRLSIFGSTPEQTNNIMIIAIISAISVTAIGGYFFLKKKKEK